MNNSPLNPVTRRLLQAHSDWSRFANNEHARFLYWRTSDADSEMVKSYFSAQRKLSCTVVHLRSPIESMKQYGDALAVELIAFYEKHREGSARNGIVADWQPPARHDQPGHQYLFEVAFSLIRHHPDVFPALILVLEPGHKPDAHKLQQFLDLLLTHTRTAIWASGLVRVVQYGEGNDEYARLFERWPRAAWLVKGQYRMEALPRELIADSGERGPSGEFRRLFVEMGEVIQQEDPKRLEELRAKALGIAHEQNWFDQATTINLLAGAAYLKWKSNDSALDAYQQATVSAKQALEKSHPAGNKLVVNALFGEASVHLVKSDHAAAARRYMEAAAYAEAEKDGLLSVEAWRMCSYCLERRRLHDEAIEAGFRALRDGAWIDPVLRSNSNLGLVVKWMLSQIGFFHKQRGALETHLEHLYGTEWKQAIEPLTQEEVSERILASAAGEDD